MLVTGASGAIGAACVRAFAGEGARVAAHYRAGAERAEALRDLPGVRLVQADLADEAATGRMVQAAIAGLDGLDVLVANAGIWPEEPLSVAAMPLERWERTLRVNLTGTFLACRAFLRHVAGTGHGSIVLVSSTAGLVGEEGHADYAASKAALTGLMLSLKNEIVRVAPLGRVNTVAPGWVATPMSSSVLEQEVAVARVTATMALRKIATPEDVARQVVVLASDELSGHVTGQVVTVAGGMEGRLLHPPGAAGDPPP